MNDQEPVNDSGILFDDNHNIRIVDPEKVGKSQAIQEGAQQFSEKLLQFQDHVNDIMKVMGAHADRVENEKLKAIGMRNRVHSEIETRQRKTREYQMLIAEKQIELDRYNMEYESLLKVEHEQRKLIERLSNNEPDPHES